MKVIPNYCINLKIGINQTRKIIKNHEIIKAGIVEWRKTRTCDDEEIKNIFGVDEVWSNKQMEEFMEKHKSWSKEDEEILFEECKGRLTNLINNN